MFSALSESINTLWTIFSIYVSIVFAFLVASYLVAGNLARTLASIIITLYTLVALWSLFGLNRTAATVVAIIFEIKRAVLETNSSLAWHPAVSTPNQIFSAYPAFITALALVAYVGSIFFFFQQRRLKSIN